MRAFAALRDFLPDLETGARRSGWITTGQLAASSAVLRSPIERFVNQPSGSNVFHVHPERWANRKDNLAMAWRVPFHLDRIVNKGD
jgi:hypothetical protein